MFTFSRKRAFFNKRLPCVSEKLSIDNKIRVSDDKYPGALRLAELGKDEFDFRWGERAAAQVTEMRESRIDGDPLTELMPGCLRAELGEVLKGELRAPKRSDVLFHIVLVFV